MSPGRRRWSLGSLLLLLGGNLAVLIQIHQDSVNGTVGQSVLLPVSYKFDGASCFPLSIRWMFGDSRDVIIACAVQNCSLDAGGAPSNCSAAYFSQPAYHGRAEVFPANGSLLLRDLKLNDSGAYHVAFKQSTPTRLITLAVHDQHSSPDPTSPTNSKDQEHTRYWTTGVSSSVALLVLLLLFCCLRHWGAAQQKRRIIKQQQASGVEEPCMESTMAGDVETIYARIGDSFEQPQLRPTPEVVYTSITPPEPPGLDTGLYHVVV